MSHRLIAFVLVAPVLLGSCENDPVTFVPEPAEEFSVQLDITPHHVHILQTEVTFTVTITDHHGQQVTDFETLQVERLLEGTETWRGTDLTLKGEVYTGTYTFTTSGDYHLRVAGTKHGQAEPVVLYEHPQHLHVVSAHTEAGGYRVEFESFPGHIHEGDTSTMRFWVMEVEKDEAGNRSPITGLASEIRCTEASGAEQEYETVESEGGVYEADHTFTEVGEAHIALHFTGADGQPAEAEFHLHVVHAH